MWFSSEITQSFLRSPSEEYLSFSISIQVWSIVCSKRIFEWLQLFSCYKAVLGTPRKITFGALFFFPISAHSTAASSVKVQSLQRRLTVFLREWQRTWTLRGSVYTERKLCECCGFLMPPHLNLLPEKASFTRKHVTTGYCGPLLLTGAVLTGAFLVTYTSLCIHKPHIRQFSFSSLPPPDTA